MNSDSFSHDRRVPVIPSEVIAADHLGYDHYDPGAGANPPSSAIGAALFLNAFQQWWKWIIPTGMLLAGCVATVLILLFEPEYRASALIEIENTAPYIAFQTGGNAKAGQQYVRTQIELMKSPVVLEPVLSHPQVAELKELDVDDEKVEYLASRMNVRQLNGSELYRVEFTSKDPAGSRDVVNAIVAEYFKVQQENDYYRKERVIELLEQEQNKRKFEVERMRQHVLGLTKEVTGQDPYARQGVAATEVALSPLATISRRIVETDVLREELKARIQAHQEESASGYLPSSDEMRLIAMEVKASPEVRLLESEIEQFREQLQMTGSVGTGPTRYRGRSAASRETEQLQAGLAHREQLLESTQKQMRREIIQRRLADRRLGQDRALDDLQRQLNVANEQYAALKLRYDEEVEKLKKSGATGVELEFARAELDREDRVYEMIAGRRLALQTEQRAPARVRLRLEASVPKRPVEELPFKPLLAGCALALAVPYVAAVGWELIVRRIANPEQLSEHSQLPVLAEVAQHPAIPVRTASARVSRRVQRELSVVEECIDGLRTTLALTDSLRAAGVLAVTSATKGEGKTTISTQLAQSIARSVGKPTLLIDGDTRSPDAHRHFNMPNGPGLTAVLAEGCEVMDAIQRVNGGPLHILSAGRLKGRPHDCMQSDRVENLIELLRQKFPYIVIDLPPVLSASESMVFARHADSVLLCCMRDVSKVRQVQAAVERLVRAKAKIRGAVLSGTPVKTYVYRYGAYAYATSNLDDQLISG